MNSRQRVLAFLDGEPVDRPPVMPVVMMLCADQIGVKYGQYVTDHQILAEAQIRTADTFDLDIVSIMSDPGAGSGRLRCACRVLRRPTRGDCGKRRAACR